ncbi:MAG: hypothetical protein RBT49_19185 [Bacteroidales bacterium]|nr:hypothetical protein [Bacteroidales bacterium]
MKKRKPEKVKKLKRIFKGTILFNEKEIQAINHYCKKYKITNKSKMMREMIIGSILKKFDEDYPTLFENTPNLFNQNGNS